MDKKRHSLITGWHKLVGMDIRIFRCFAVAIFYLVIANGCSDRAQEAAEKANRDTVPVIETQPDKDTAVTNRSAEDSLVRDSAGE